jgi:hypothetical protein
VQHTNKAEKYVTVGLVFRWIINMPVSLAKKNVQLTRQPSQVWRRRDTEWLRPTNLTQTNLALEPA